MSLWQSAAERAGAVDGVLRVGGADRLRDASCVSSRNIELLDGWSFSHGTFDGEQPRAVAVPHEDAETRRPVYYISRYASFSVIKTVARL